VKILVTGGSGFIGTHLVRSLVQEGHAVTVLDNNSTSNPELKPHPKAKYVIGDISDLHLVETLVSQSDYVFHLASTVGVFRVLSNPVDSIHSTLFGGINILKTCQRYGKRVLLTSTSEIYGKTGNGPLLETDDRLIGQTSNFRWIYSEAKAMLESVAFSLTLNPNPLDFVIVRLFNTVGPGQLPNHGMVIPRFVKSALKDEKILIYGNGAQTRTFCDVRDTVRALKIFLHDSSHKQEIFNIGGIREISIFELAKLIKNLTKSSSNIDFLDYEAAYLRGFEDTMRRIPDISKILISTGWVPEYSLEEIIESVIKYEKFLI
jgi:UDP-glucose 4-epimerase